MACRLFDAKLLPEPILTYGKTIICISPPLLLIRLQGANFCDIIIEIETSSLTKYIVKCPLQSGGRFVLASICWRYLIGTAPERRHKHHGPFLPTWVNFNPNIDK